LTDCLRAIQITSDFSGPTPNYESFAFDLLRVFQIVVPAFWWAILFLFSSGGALCVVEVLL